MYNINTFNIWNAIALTTPKNPHANIANIIVAQNIN